MLGFKSANGIKKIIISAVAAALVGSVGFVGYSVNEVYASAKTFPENGYILTDDPNVDGKQILFESGEKYKNAVGDNVSFKDIQGTKTDVPEKSYVHYDSGAVSSLSQGVVVDLNDIDTAQLTNHYAISSALIFAKNGGSYSITNAETPISFDEFMWKLDENKYMLVSPQMEIHFADSDVKETTDFIEIKFIDDGVIQLQTAENLWQTVSDNCYVETIGGKHVDLSYRNIQNGKGDVLLDFNKIVIDADANVEIVPLTAELNDVFETIIPHFNITAKNGTNGNIGVSGESGEPGGAGNAGNAGTAGANGAAGAAGTAGTTGKAGIAGTEGGDGKSAKVAGTVYKFPIFTVTDWTVTATGCSGKIIVEDSNGMLVSGNNNKFYLLDETTGQVTNYANAYHFSELNPDGYTFSFSDLKPDHSYRLVVDDMVDVDGNQYSRNFVSKSFYTDSTGAYLEASSSTTNSVSLYVVKNNYVSSKMMVGLRFFSTRSEALIKESEIAGAGFEYVDVSAGGRVLKTNDSLDSNTTVYARYAYSLDGTQNYTLLSDQILELKTLKKTPTLAAPTLSSNRASWGFEVTPGLVNDPDYGIISYAYEFYKEGDVNASTNTLRSSSVEPVKVATYNSANAELIPIDGTSLETNQNYYVRVVASFNDNEKTYTVESPLSNACELSGSKVPSVYITDINGKASDYITSSYYDQVVGKISVIPAANGGARLLLSTNFHPVVTVYDGSSYYAQYQVYLEDDPAKPSDNTTKPSEGPDYLVGTVLSDGTVEITLPAKADTSLNVNPRGAVNGLKPDNTYMFSVTGALSEDGITATEQNSLIGRCIVKTPGDAVIKTRWFGPSGDGSVLNNVSFSFEVNDTSSASEKVQFNRQLQALQSLTVNIYRNSSMTGQIIGTLTLTNDSNLMAFRKNTSDTVTNLGELVRSGINIKDGDFNLKPEDVSGLGAIFVAVQAVYDYTNVTENTVHMSKDNGASSAIYTNEFELVSYLYEIKLTAGPDPIPDNLEGFGEKLSSITQKDSDKDGAVDRWTMTADYANTNKLVTAITYYVFDSVAFYKDYDDTKKYKLNDDYNTKVTYRTPVTCCNNDGTPLYLGKVTIPMEAGVASSKYKIPEITFIPSTAEQFFREALSSKYNGTELDDQVALAKKEYNTYGSFDGKYYLFYASSSTPVRGHQFVFAWTLDYTQDSVAKKYPFDVQTYKDRVTSNESAYGKDGYLSIPHSFAYTSPRITPTVYALPWASDDTTSSYKAYIYDPDGVVQCVEPVAAGDPSGLRGYAHSYMSKSSDNNYWSYISATESRIPVYTQDIASMTDFMQSASIVTIGGFNANDEQLSVAVSVRAQYFTDDYIETVGRDWPSGLFDPTDDSKESTYFAIYSSGSGDYRPESTGLTLSKDSSQPQSSYSRYLSAFTLFKDKLYNYADHTSGLSTTANIVSNNSSAYEVTVTVPDKGQELVNGFRVKVTPTSGPGIQSKSAIVLDKYLYSLDSDGYIDTVADGNLHTITYKFELSFSEDLSDLTGYNIDIDVSVLYETNSFGYSYINNPGTSFGLINYSAYTKNLTYGDRQWKELGRQIFSKVAGKIALGSVSRADNSLIYRFGGFFNLTTKCGVSSGSTAKERNAFTLNVDSTRAFQSQARQYSSSIAEIDPASSYSASQGVVIVPVVLAEHKITTTLPAGGLGTVPKSTPIIIWGELPLPSPNYVSCSYDITGGLTVSASSPIFFTLGRSDGSGQDSYYLVHKVLSSGAIQWTPSAITVNDIKNATYAGITEALAALNTNGNKLLWEFTDSTSDMYFVVENKSDVNYQVIAWVYDQDKQKLVRLNQRTTGSLTENYINIQTGGKISMSLAGGRVANNPFVASYWNDKYINCIVNVSNFRNFYYTLELQEKNSEGNYERITYLDAGDSDGSYSVGWSHYFFVTGKDSAHWNYTQQTQVASGVLGYNYHGDLKKVLNANITDNFTVDSQGIVKLADPGANPEYVVLNNNTGTDGKYRVQVRLYTKGTGPAYGGDETADLLEAESDDTKTLPFDVNLVEDTMNLYASTSILKDATTGAKTARFSFTPSFTAGSYLERNGNMVPLFILKAEYSNKTVAYYDVSSYAVNGSDNSNVVKKNNYFSPNGKYNFYLDIPEALLNAIANGDAYANFSVSCYLYSIVNSSQTTQAYPYNESDLLKNYEHGMTLRDHCMANNKESLNFSNLNMYYVDNIQASGASPTVRFAETIAALTDSYSQSVVNSNIIPGYPGIMQINNNDMANIYKDYSLANGSGVSRLMAFRTVEYGGTSTSVGTVNISYTENTNGSYTFVLNMQNPISASKIVTMEGSIVVHYHPSDTDNTACSATYNIQDTNFAAAFTKSSTGDHSYVLWNDEFTGLSGGIIDSMVVTLSFYDNEGEGVYCSSSSPAGKVDTTTAGTKTVYKYTYNIEFSTQQPDPTTSPAPAPTKALKVMAPLKSMLKLNSDSQSSEDGEELSEEQENQKSNQSGEDDSGGESESLTQTQTDPPDKSKSQTESKSETQSESNSEESSESKNSDSGETTSATSTSKSTSETTQSESSQEQGTTESSTSETVSESTSESASE